MKISNKNEKFAFYGAGNYAMDNFNRFISAGYIPFCFVDSDASKHNTIFGNTGIEIANLDSVMVKYPYCRFLLTVAGKFYREVYEYLRSRGVAHDRIELPEEMVYRMGCPMFENTMVIAPDEIIMCCGSAVYDFYELSREPAFAFPFDAASDDSLLSAIDAYENAMAVLLKKWTGFEKNPCDKCPYLQQNFYPKTIKMRNVLTGGWFADDVCNFSCIYCIAADMVKKKNDLYDVIMKLARHVDCRDTVFSFSTKEFLARKNCNEILQFLYDKGAKFSLTSNSSIYNETLASLIRDGRVVGINTSLDAGTAETFAKVKGADINCFKRTIANISRYSGLGCRYYLKYLILPGINDNEDDINGFVDICNAMQPVFVTISTDKHNRSIRLERKTMDMAFLLDKNLAGRGLKTVWALEDFNVDDMEIIRSHAGESMQSL